MTNPSTVRRTYDAIALFALINLLGLASLCAYFINNGSLDAEKGRRMLAVFRGEDDSSSASEAEIDDSQTKTDEAGGPVGVDLIAESEMGIEIMRREGERIKAELDQRLALNNSIMLRVTAEREQVKRERDDAAKQQQTSMQQRNTEGFRKQIAIYESLAPKVAVQHLLSLGEPDDAAKILLEMDTGKAKKIVEAAKRGDRMNKMMEILRRVREVAPDRSGELERSDR